MSRSSVPRIQVTKNYRLFSLFDANRPVNVSKHKALMRNMKEYGFVPQCPIICVRKGGSLYVVDGQHRLAIAEELGLPVYWVERGEHEPELSVADFNRTSVNWSIRNYAESHAKSGIKAYADLLEFADKWSLPVSLAVCLLSGTVCFHNVSTAFFGGKFRIKDQPHAEAVANSYRMILDRAPKLKNARLVEALVAADRAKGFDHARLCANLDRCSAKLRQFSSRDEFLDMLEEIYNFGKKTLVPLKINAIQAMRDRNPNRKTK